MKLEHEEHLLLRPEQQEQKDQLVKYMCPRSTSSLNIPKMNHPTLMSASKTNAPLTTCGFLRSSPPLNLQRQPQQAHSLCKNCKEKEIMELSCGSRLTIAWCTTRRLKTRLSKRRSTFTNDPAGGVRKSDTNFKCQARLRPSSWT